MRGQIKGDSTTWCWLGFVILLPIGLFGCGGSGETAIDTHLDDPEEIHAEDESEEVTLTPEQIRAAKIEIVQSRAQDLQKEVEATGIIAPDETRVAHIRPLSRGVIEEVYVRRGDRVEKDQPLILYDNIELGELIGKYRQLRARLKEDQAHQEVTRKFWERGVELLEYEAIARREVEFREAEYKNGQARVQSRFSEIAGIEEKLHRLGLSEDEVRELDLVDSVSRHRTASHDTLRAPFAGVIIEYDVAEGELVEPDREVLTIADVSMIWALADVYQRDLGTIRTGVAVQILSSSYPDRIFEGTLTYISDVMDRETRTAKVRCVVPNQEGLLKLEMFITLKIPTVEKHRGVVVPVSALQNIDGQDVIFLDHGDGTFRPQAVETGLSQNEWIEVEDLDEGVAVVGAGSFYLKSEYKRSEIDADHGH